MNSIGKGKVQIKAPAVKLEARVPGQDASEEQIEEWQQHDGYEGACGIIQKPAESSHRREME
ncbi:hypothetical protein [Marinicrinis lubricantis]|uniref:Uncharacterized protein n=1 Tax=Marinicrinis lubricantis TaxID=2086470 RepID=A0ABW1IQ10_9BACL